MFVDARLLTTVPKSRVCIVGAGPAGILIAREFLNAGLNVSMLESGSLDHNSEEHGRPAANSEYAGPLHGLRTTRQFGGNANQWHIDTGEGAHSVRMVQFSDADFEAREWIPESGWPISAEEFKPFYTRAQRACGLPPLRYEPEGWESDTAKALPLAGTELRTGIFQFADSGVFLNTYRAQLAAAQDVTVYHNATALRLETNETADRVLGVRIATSPGHELSVPADIVVLATGGLVAPQLLLASDQRQPGGLGNAHDLVGRYHMDHPLLVGGQLIPSSPSLFERMALYDLRNLSQGVAMGFLRLSDEALRSEPCSNISALLFPRTRMSPRRERAYAAAKRLRASTRQGGSRWRLTDVARVAVGVDGIAQRIYRQQRWPDTHVGRGGWSMLSHLAERYTHFDVVHQAEQLPNYTNRVVLSQERDAFGSRRVELHWRFYDNDIQLIERAQAIIARELNRAGIGEFRIQRPFEIQTSSTNHFMGTTRMHSDPARGVVDAHCRVHGIPNLYISASSVFPTGSFANPTLTTFALSLRVADDVKRTLGIAPSASAEPERSRDTAISD